MKDYIELLLLYANQATARRNHRGKTYLRMLQWHSMKRVRSRLGSFIASTLLTGVVCLQFCATTCALGDCTLFAAKRFDRQTFAENPSHCHQHSDRSTNSKEHKKDDPKSCHQANEVVAAFPDTADLIS